MAGGNPCGKPIGEETHILFVQVRVLSGLLKLKTMKSINDYLSTLSIESLMELSEKTNSNTFEENSIVRKIINEFNLSQNDFICGVIGLRENILKEITKRYYGKLK